MAAAVLQGRVRSKTGKQQRLARATIEQMLVYCQYLGSADQALVESVYNRGMALHTLARVAHMRTRTLRERLDRLVARMNKPEFRYVVKHQYDWTEERRAIARLVILEGNTHRAAAAALNISTHRVRLEVHRIRVKSEAGFEMKAETA